MNNTLLRKRKSDFFKKSGILIFDIEDCGYNHILEKEIKAIIEHVTEDEEVGGKEHAVAVNLRVFYMINEKESELAKEGIVANLESGKFIYMYCCDKNQSDIFSSSFGDMYKKRFRVAKYVKNLPNYANYI